MSDKEFKEITLKEFDAMDMGHTFSDDYKQKKQKFVNAVRQKEGSRNHNYIYKVVAAVAVISLIPASAYAADKWIRMQNQNTGNYSNSLLLTKENQEKTFTPVKLTAEYLPEGSTEAVSSGPYKYEVPSDNGSGAHSTFFVLYQMDTEEFQFDEDYVIACEEFDAGGRDAVLLTFDSRTVYDKTAYVIFDDLQYVAEVSMGKGITTDEAKKIAEGITLTPTEKENATYASSMAEWKKELETLAEQADTTGTDTMTMLKQGEAWTDEISGYQLAVKEVEVLDNIRSLEAKYFTDNGEHIPEGAVDKDGNMTAYERPVIQTGDGITSINEQTGTTHVNRKLVYVTLEITNPADAAREGKDDEACVNFQLCIPEKNADGKYENKFFEPQYDSIYNEPVYFDASNCSSNTDHHYFFTTVGRGESVICHLGYVVDEDMLGQIYMDTDYSDEMKLIDVRK